MKISSNRRPGQIDRHAILALLLIFSWAMGIPALFVVIWQMFLNFTKDTTPLSNVAFGVLALLANTSFSYARTMDPGQETRKKAIQVGEDFFLSAMIFATASLVKYTLVQMVKDAAQGGKPDEAKVHIFFLGWISGLSFVAATGLAFWGLLEVSTLLLRRRQGQ